ncbi:sigma-70 family RNA polymerase sigma factor [Acidaminobacterium chupaoyuni]
MAQNSGFEYSREIEDSLAREYVKLVRSCIRPFFLTGGDYDDLEQEGMIGLLKAIRGYDPAKSDSFEAYAVLCIRRQIYDAVKKSQRKDGHLTVISASEDQVSDRVSNIKVQQDPETEVLAKESALEIQSALSGLLSAFETSVLRYYLEGYTTSQIAQMLKKENKSVDNAIQRIRRKLAKYLANGR